MKRKRILRLLAATAAALLLLSVFGCSSSESQQDTPKDPPLERGKRISGFELTEVATNSRFTLSCDPDYGTLLLEDKQTGRIYRSNPENPQEDPLAKGVTRTNMRSQIIITVANQKGNIDSYNSAVDAVGENGFVISRTENGIIMIYSVWVKIPIHTNWYWI